jgi:hypothetical protein
MDMGPNLINGCGALACIDFGYGKPYVTIEGV